MRRTNRKGFTLIELLIVVVIIGILAAIAIPKFSNTKEKAFVASMKADLKNLVGVQESFFADSGKYAASYDAIKVAPWSYQLSPGNATVQFAGDSSGWSATMKNGAVKTTSQDECGIYVGTGAAATSPNATAVKSDGAPGCF